MHSETGTERVDQTPANIELQPIEALKSTRGRAARRRLLRESLQNVLDRATALEAEGEHGVHQLRVALRRARTAASIVRRADDDGMAEELAIALRWASQELGPVRDLDTLLRESLVSDTAESPAGLDALRARALENRSRAFAAAEASVRARGWEEQLERAIARLDDGDADGHASRELSAGAARAELQRRWKKLKKRARHANGGGVEALHALRIQAKKHRFTIELFADAFPDAKHKRDRMLAALKRLLDRLGALNDIATHRSLLAGFAADADGVGSYAAGFLAGRESACTETLIVKAEKTLRKLIEVKPFWK